MTHADAFADLDPELRATRRVLERLPADRLDFRPHPKSWTLGELATHVANIPLWMTATLRDDGIDLAAIPRSTGLPSPEAILEAFDRHADDARAAWAETTADALEDAWTVRYGERVMSQQPRRRVLRSSGLSHLVHHRAQLTVYLRLLDVPVPGLYGPSADDR
jgi:uncharacterized damage-inducible protein DinB